MFFLLICEMRKVDFSFLLLQCAASCRWPTTISGRWLTAHSSAAQRSSGLLGLLTDICSWNTFLTSSFYKAGVWGRITHTVLCVLRHVLFIWFQQTNPQGSCCCPGLPRLHTQQALRLFACRQRVSRTFVIFVLSDKQHGEMIILQCLSYTNGNFHAFLNDNSWLLICFVFCKITS